MKTNVVQVNDVISKILQIAKYQMIVSHGPNYRDDLAFKVELAQEDVDKEEFLPQGTFPEKYEWVIDTRTWE